MPIPFAALAAGVSALSSLFGGKKKSQLAEAEIAARNRQMKQSDNQFAANHARGLAGDRFGAARSLFEGNAAMDNRARDIATQNTNSPLIRNLLNKVAARTGAAPIDFEGRAPIQLRAGTGDMAAEYDKMKAIGPYTPMKDEPMKKSKFGNIMGGLAGAGLAGLGAYFAKKKPKAVGGYPDLTMGERP